MYYRLPTIGLLYFVLVSIIGEGLLIVKSQVVFCLHQLAVLSF